MEGTTRRLLHCADEPWYRSSSSVRLTSLRGFWSFTAPIAFQIEQLNLGLAGNIIGLLESAVTKKKPTTVDIILEPNKMGEEEINLDRNLGSVAGFQTRRRGRRRRRHRSIPLKKTRSKEGNHWLLLLSCSPWMSPTGKDEGDGGRWCGHGEEGEDEVGEKMKLGIRGNVASTSRCRRHRRLHRGCHRQWKDEGQG